MLKRFFFLLFFCPLSLFSNTPENFYLISIAKSGTNLIQKCLEKMTHRKRLYCPTANVASNCKSKNLFLGTHFLHTRALNEITKSHLNDKVIINIRDPRDIFVSAVFYYSFLTYYFPANDTNIRKCYPFDTIDAKQRIRAYLIEGMRGRKIPTPLYEVKAACEYLKKHSDYLLIKFEDLVGEKGGGTQERQIENIKKVADYLKVECTDKEIEEMISTIFGDTSTFRKGQIGAWKNYFDEDMKSMFKALLGEELIFLGYEQDLNW